jgi:hypothetical protein
VTGVQTCALPIFPVLDPNSTSEDLNSENSFYVVSVEPELGATLVKIANKGFASLNSVFIQTLENTSQYNGWRFEVEAGGIAGAEQVQYQQGKILVIIELGVSSTHQVVDALMANLDFVENFTAFAMPKSEKMQIGKTRIARGVDDNTIVITFNKAVDPTSVEGKFKITKSEVYPFTLEEELYCNVTVQGEKLILTIED